MFKIFEIRGKRFEYSNNIRAQKLSNPNPNIRDSRKKIRIRIESKYIRSSLLKTSRRRQDRKLTPWLMKSINPPFLLCLTKSH